MRSERGQVLVLCLIMAWIGAAALWLVFNTGQLVSAKARTVTAADTAAWSAATWRARVLNYSAYSNRAIVAQEVAVAQAITLESWAYYFENFTETVKKLSRVYPPAYTFARAVADSAEASRQATQLAAASEVRLRDAPGYGYKSLLAHSQRVMHYTAGNFALSAVAQEVAGTADNRLKAYVLAVGTVHKDFVTRYETDSQRGRLRDVVVDSLDRFTAGSRDANFLLPVPAGCVPSGSSPKDAFWHYRKRGGTHLAPGLDRWEAADTGSIHSASMSFWSRRCRPKEVFPMGWGAAQVAAGRPHNGIVGNPGDVRLNRTALRRAERAMSGPARPAHRGTGIAKVFDLNYSGLSNTRYPVSRVVVLAKLAEHKIRSATRISGPGRALADSLSLPDDKMRAVGVAEVYFRRPPAAPARVEYASLYNPFWQVRLSSATSAEREAASHAP